MSRLTLIVAATRSNGIGQNSRLPWRLPQEMAYFARLTTNAPQGSMNAVIMGRHTWESIPNKFRPLSKRVNIVISKNENYELPESQPVYLHRNLDAALHQLSDVRTWEKPVYRSFIIGGASLYTETLSLPPSSPSFVDRILLTRILSPAFENCDVFMPDFHALSPAWRRASHQELQAWAGFEVPEGVQEENGVQYEFQMWTR